MNLLERYNNLLSKYHMGIMDDCGSISGFIRDSMNDFMNHHKRVALYCYGEHTKALMAEYIYEVRNMVCIIDNGDIDVKHQGFKIIKDDEIDSMEIDGIIISSYQYRNEIKASLQKNHKNIDFLDFYEAMSRCGIKIECEFYKAGMPYQIYDDINNIYQDIAKGVDVSACLWNLVKKFVAIKDFRLASQTVKELYDITLKEKYQDLAKDLDDLYACCLKVVAKSTTAVLLMCIDGLKGEEFCPEGYLSQTYHATKSKATIYTRAYSYSSSTFESLMPVFSENYDQHSNNYLESNTVSSAECRFIKFAKEQGRNIYIYGCGKRYIDDPEIRYRDRAQTITQMMWNFINDLETDSNGLFYMQPVYESHFSFPSPYYKQDNMVSEGSSLFFDYLSTKGGKLRTEYSSQYSAAMRYIDDTLAPVLEKIECNVFFFSDHGNYNYKEIEKKQLEGIEPNELTACEDLFRIPMVIISSHEKGEASLLISLSELNNIALALMKDEKFDYAGRQYVKIGRTAIYNPDYKYIYTNILHSEHSLCAFEGFIFEDGYKLIVFSDGTKELYTIKDDKLVTNNELIEKYYRVIADQVST